MPKKACECCGRLAGSPIAGNKETILGFIHLDNDPDNNSPENLKIVCQLCYSKYFFKQREKDKNKQLGLIK